MSIDVMQALEDAAKGRPMDYSKWPDILQGVLQRIDHAVHHDFPTVRVPAPAPAPAPVPSPQFRANGEATQAQATPPPGSPHSTTIPATPQPPAGSETNAPGSSAATEDPTAPSSPSVVPNSQPPGPEDDVTPARPSGRLGIARGPTGGATSNAANATAGSLPPQLAALYDQIQGALHGPFGTKPPFTVQRLAELVLEPRRHYKTLPAYLRALAKVLSVSSTADVYPLKTDAPTNTGGGSGTAVDSFMTSSDEGATGFPMHEGFNGAELEPIPWLRKSQEREGAAGSDDGEADAPGDMVGGGQQAQAASGGAATAGQSRYGEGQQTTLVNGLSRAVPADTAAMQAEQDTDVGPQQVGRHAGAGAGEHDQPHSRGPEEIGDEDIGPQRVGQSGMPGIVDLEAAVGRPGEGEVVPGSNVQVPDERAQPAGTQEPRAAEEEQDKDGGEDV